MEIISVEHFDLARKIVSHMTSESWRTIPHVCVACEHDASEFMSVLGEINAHRRADKKITLNTAMLKVITECLKACPKMNGHIAFRLTGFKPMSPVSAPFRHFSPFSS